MGMGLQTAFGNDALQQLLARRTADRIAEEQRQFQNQRQLSADARAQQGLDLQSQLRQDTLAETKRQHDLQDSDRNMGVANALAEQIPGGAFLPQSDPAVGMLRSGGRGSLLTAQPAIAAQGPDFQGPAAMPNGTTIQDEQQGRPEGFIKTATAGQQQKAGELAQRTDYQNWLNSINQQKADAGPKEPTPHFSFFPTYDAEGKPNGMASGNTLTGAVSQIGGAPTIKPKPGAAADVEHERVKTETLGTLDQIDQAIEQARNFLGPGAGRVTSIQQMIGSQDPAIQALGTKILYGKMQVDHAATGTVRAGASPQLLARWDNILSQNVTPEGLHAAIQAMREVISGKVAAAPPKHTGAPAAPAGWHYVPKPGGGWTAERDQP